MEAFIYFFCPPQFLEMIVLALPLWVGCSKSMWHIKIFLREHVEFLCGFSHRAQKFKNLKFKNSFLFFPEVIFQQWELLSFYAVYSKLPQGILFHHVLCFMSFLIVTQIIFKRFQHKVSLVTAQQLWVSGHQVFPGRSDGANSLQIQEQLQPEKTGSLEMEGMRDHRASYRDQGDIAWINFCRSKEN